MTNFVKKNQEVILIAFVIVVIYFAFFNEAGKMFGDSNGNGNGVVNGAVNGAVNDVDVIDEDEDDEGEGEGSDYALDNYPRVQRSYLDYYGASMGLW